MFMQSAAMALGFGSFFQYGKRRISSMSNDEFNALTPEALTADLMSSINNMIPTVQQSFQQMEQMNVLILDAMAKYFNQAVDKIEQWIGEGVHGFQHNVQSGIIDPIVEFNPDDIPSFIPTAGASEQTFHNLPSDKSSSIQYTAVEQFAQRWIRADGTQANFSTITEKETLYLLKQISKGNLNIYKSWRKSLLKKLETFKQPTPPTQQEIKTKIEKTSTGIVQQIAILYNNLVFMIRAIQKLKNNKKQKAAYLRNIKAFLNEAKKYNQFVAKNRKPKLQIDTAKSIKAGHIVPKR